MSINEMLKVIEVEELDVYNKIVYGSIYYGGENCISFKKNEDGSMQICAIGERGRVIFDETIKDETVACNKIIDRLRIGKRLAQRFLEKEQDKSTYGRN